MIYLFVTGKSSAYLDDVFTTLHLPFGAGHCYKYPCKDISLTVAANANEKACSSGESVLVSFFDREAQNDGQLYIPLRYGRLKKCELSEGQFYYEVVLQEYCHTDDEKAYSRHILDTFQRQTRHRDESGAMKGVLVIRNDESEDEYTEKNSEKSWSSTVRLLSCRSLFRKYYSIFTKMELTDREGRPVKPAAEEEYRYDLIIGKEYIVRLSYIIPSFNADSMVSVLACLEDSRGICGVLKKECFLESEQGKFELKLWPDNKSDMMLTSLSISVQDKSVNQKDVRYAKRAVDVRVRSRIRKGLKYVMQGACVVGICISTFLTALPYGGIMEDTNALIAGQVPLTYMQEIIYDISCMLDKHQNTYSLICSIVMSLSTFLLVKFTGEATL